TSSQTPLSTDPTVSVQGAFSFGGNSRGTLNDTLDRYEFQNYTSITAGKHFVKFGARLRASQDSNLADSNFNGTFSFGSRPNPVARARCSPTPPPNPPPAECAPIRGIEAYQRTLAGLSGPNPMTIDQIIAAGGGASQYAITLGTGKASVSYFDAGLY